MGGGRGDANGLAAAEGIAAGVEDDDEGSAKGLDGGAVVNGSNGLLFAFMGAAPPKIMPPKSIFCAFSCLSRLSSSFLLSSSAFFDSSVTPSTHSALALNARTEPGCLRHFERGHAKT